MLEENRNSSDVPELFQILQDNLQKLDRGQTSDIPLNLNLQGGVQDLNEGCDLSLLFGNKESR